MATLHQEIQRLLEQARDGDGGALKKLGSQVTKGDAHEALVSAGGLAVEPMAQIVVEMGGKKRKAAAQVLAAVADRAEGPEIEEATLLLLESIDKTPLVKLGLEIVSKARHPPASWLEPSADMSGLLESKQALMRYPFAKVRRELKSLITSQAPDERIVGLGLVRHYGLIASEFAPLVREGLAQNTHAESARLAVHTLARLLSDEALPEALEPALDHWDEDVQKAAKRYLSQVDAPVRSSQWEGHPFSTSLRIQLQRFGFKPLQFNIPTDRPLPSLSERPFLYSERLPEDDHVQIGAAAWALVPANAVLAWPPYQLYTVWGSHEDQDTFHFGPGDSEAETAIFPANIGGQRRLMHVIGDGSIGYYATIDLLDTSDDPAVYYIERWGIGWSDSAWRQSYTLSSYLRQIGLRR
ncbi:MAG: hypothetical protein AAFX99_06695 [Myxococcota bacterium]